MPVEHVQHEGRPAYRWGASGHPYPYRPGDERDRRRARLMAERQGLAIRASADAKEVDGDRQGAWKIRERGAPTPRAYVAAVRRWMRQVRRLVMGLLAEALATVPASDADEADDEARRLREARRRIEAASLSLREAIRRARLPRPDLRVLEGIGQAAARVAIQASRRTLLDAGMPRADLSRRLDVDLQLLTGIDIAPTVAEQALVRGWATEGTDLIVSVGQDLVAGLDEHILEVARTGALTSDLRRVVMERLGVAERHAQFIARDQIAKLNGRITEATQVAAGVTEYTWRAVHDQRTRPDHAALDGTTHRWDDPPVVDQRTGRREHPGGDYQCRCFARPIIPAGPT